MHPNEKVLRDIDAAQMANDEEGFFGHFTDDVIVHLPGKSALAGTYKGKQEFAELFQLFMERSPEYSFEAHAYLADDEHGVSMQRSHYQRGDERIDTNDTFICHFRDGKVSEFWIATDDPYRTDSFLG